MGRMAGAYAALPDNSPAKARDKTIWVNDLERPKENEAMVTPDNPMIITGRRPIRSKGGLSVRKWVPCEANAPERRPHW